jgi:hypothetical protein
MRSPAIQATAMTGAAVLPETWNGRTDASTDTWVSRRQPSAVETMLAATSGRRRPDFVAMACPMVDPVERIARAEAGVLSLELVRAAAQHGLASVAGSSRDVGVVGYTLGVGLSGGSVTGRLANQRFRRVCALGEYEAGPPRL